jgi:hypothetical protein
MYVQSEQTKQVADLLAQSNPNNEATDVFNCAFRDQKYLFEHTGQHNSLPLTCTSCGSFFLKSCIVLFLKK